MLRLLQRGGVERGSGVWGFGGFRVSRACVCELSSRELEFKEAGRVAPGWKGRFESAFLKPVSSGRFRDRNLVLFRSRAQPGDLHPKCADPRNGEGFHRQPGKPAPTITKTRPLLRAKRIIITIIVIIIIIFMIIIIVMIIIIMMIIIYVYC